MMWLVISVCFVCLIPAYLLLAPFYIEVNSLNDLYRIRFHRLVCLSIKNRNGTLSGELKFLFWKKEINLLSRQKQIQAGPEPEKHRRAKTFTLKQNALQTVLKTFKITTCDLALDTGNMQLNGMLYPLVYFTGAYYKKQIGINFIGKNHLVLEIENNLARMIYAYIKS